MIISNYQQRHQKRQTVDALLRNVAFTTKIIQVEIMLCQIPANFF